MKTANNFKFDLTNLGFQNLKPKVFSTSDNDLDEVADKQSYLGTPVFSNLVIPAGQYKTDEGVLIDFEGIRLDTVLFDITLPKNIVKTAINGQNGTVKQFIGLLDYEINVQGIITGGSSQTESGDFTTFMSLGAPEEEVRKLNAILKVPQEIEVVSEFLDFFDISTVVVEGGRIAQKEGSRDVLYLNMGLLSDTPIELK
jgi:hypothetical protein